MMNTKYVLENGAHIMMELGLDADEYAELACIAAFFEKYPYLNGRISNDGVKVLLKIEDVEIYERTVEDVIRMLVRKEHPPEFRNPPRPEPLERRTSKDLWPKRKGRKINYRKE